MASLTRILIQVLSSITKFFNHYIFNQIALQLNSTAMDLNALPDTVLRAVFDRVPLLDLVRHIPLVCHRWHSLQPSVLSSKKLSLTLFVGQDAKSLIEESYLAIPFGGELTNEDGSPMYPKMDDSKVAVTLTLTTLTSKRVDLMVDKLKNVNFVELCIRQTTAATVTIQLIIRLLEHWQRSLKTLKLRSLFMHQCVEISALFARLIDTVNKLPVLEHLTLDTRENLELAKPLDLSILGQLKEFYLNSSCFKSDHLFDSLKRYGEPNGQLRAIGLGNFARFDLFINKFAKSPLKKRFTNLIHICEAPGNSFMTASDRQRFTSTFTEQTNYFIGMAGLNLARMTAILAPLHNLVYLSICSDEPFNKFDDTPVDQIRSLPSVKVLDFTYMTNIQDSNHKELGSKYWSRMFPNLQIIRMNHRTISCRICDYCEFGIVREPQKVAPCLQRALLPFKQQFRRTLKKVYYSRSNDDTTKVFTPETL